jgi:hypothetical protein
MSNLIKLLTMLLMLTAFSNNSSARVWVHTKEWSQAWEVKYEKWMKSNAVHTKIYTSPKSPYYGIKADCADAAYGLRAIFSYENKLPFAINNPSGNRGRYSTIGNNTNYFDKHGPENKRLVALINYIGDIVGTEQLSYKDTFPIKLTTINPGTLFTYRTVTTTGKSIRHAYTIKNVSPTGTFDLIYATQAIAKNGLDLNLRYEKPLTNKPSGNAWGFKKFKWPRNLLVKNRNLPRERNYSMEQFPLAEEMSSFSFFKHVQKQIRTVVESPKKIVHRSLVSLCEEARARIGYVNQGVAHNKKLRGRCMNYSDYDAYSTPSRDKGLKNLYLSLLSELEDMNLNDLPRDLAAYADTIANYKTADRRMKKNLLKYCSINYRSGKSIDLGELWLRIKADLLSSHPNDKLGVRWGERGSRTSCYAHY